MAKKVKTKKEKTVKSTVIKADGGGTQQCPQGQVWSPSLNKCIDNPNP